MKNLRLTFCLALVLTFALMVSAQTDQVSFDMESKLYKKDKLKSETAITMAFSGTKAAMIIQNEEGMDIRNIFDSADGTMTMLTGTPMAVRMKQPKIDIDKDDVHKGEVSVTKTGNTKTIDGHLTEEYIVEDDRYRATVYITQDFPEIDMAALMGSFNMNAKKRGQLMGSGNNFYDVEGFPLLTISEEKGGNEKTETRFTNIKVGEVNADYFDLSGVKVMGF